MFTCPKCQIALTRERNRFGLFWVCPTCQGRVITLEVLHNTIPRFITNKLWQRARSENSIHKKKCPSCTFLMSEAPVINADKTEYLDVCPTCRLIWFDANEFQKFPKNDIEQKEQLSPEAREAEAMLKLELYKQRQQLEPEEFELSKNWADILFMIIRILLHAI